MHLPVRPLSRELPDSAPGFCGPQRRLRCRWSPRRTRSSAPGAAHPGTWSAVSFLGGDDEVPRGALKADMLIQPPRRAAQRLSQQTICQPGCTTCPARGHGELGHAGRRRVASRGDRGRFSVRPTAQRWSVLQHREITRAYRSTSEKSVPMRTARASRRWPSAETFTSIWAGGSTPDVREVRPRAVRLEAVLATLVA